MINWDLVNDVGEWLIPIAGLLWAIVVYCDGLVNFVGGV